MDLRTEEIGYSVCFRSLDVSEKLIENLSKDLNDENLRENLSAVYACKYLTIPTEYVKAAVNERQLPRALVDQLDAELSQLNEGSLRAPEERCLRRRRGTTRRNS